MKKKKPQEDALEAFQSLTKDVQESLKELAKKASSPEEFANMIMVGNCPFCESENTYDGIGASLDDPTVGSCLDCKKSWCFECGYEVKDWPCSHWSICEECDFYLSDQNEIFECKAELEPSECSIIKEKMDEANLGLAKKF